MKVRRSIATAWNFAAIRNIVAAPNVVPHEDRCCTEDVRISVVLKIATERYIATAVEYDRRGMEHRHVKELRRGTEDCCSTKDGRNIAVTRNIGAT